MNDNPNCRCPGDGRISNLCEIHHLRPSPLATARRLVAEATAGVNADTLEKLSGLSAADITRVTNTLLREGEIELRFHRTATTERLYYANEMQGGQRNRIRHQEIKACYRRLGSYKAVAAEMKINEQTAKRWVLYEPEKNRGS